MTISDEIMADIYIGVSGLNAQREASIKYTINPAAKRNLIKRHAETEAFLKHVEAFLNPNKKTVNHGIKRIHQAHR